LTGQQTALTNQSNELNTADTKFTALQTAVQGIQGALNGSSFQTTVSDPTKVSASVSDGVQEGDYAIKVDNPGAYATSLTTSTWNSSGSPATYTLVIGGSNYTIQPTDNSAATVASTINAQFGNLVNATAVNVGSSGSPDYRIALQSATLGPMNVDIQKTLGISLQTQQVVGVLASYEVNSSGVTVSSNTRSVSIATGLTLNLLATSASAVDITVTRSTSALNSALSSFANAYNAAVDEVTAQRGQLGGALQGQSIVMNLSQALSSIGTYSSSGAQVSNLENLGLDLGADGHFTYNALTLMGTDISNSAGVTAFLGSSTANASSRTTSTWVTSGGPATYTLVVGTQNYSVSATDDSAATVASAINTRYGSLVQASVVNLGSSGSPDYRISLQSATLGPMNVDILNASGTSLQTQQTNGGGFLQAATNALNGLEDPTTGLLKTTEAGVKSHITDIGTQISTKQTQVDQLQTQMQNQLAQADALIASMEQQYTYMTDLFQAQQTANQQYANE
jgi:flagellar capping protein FliD